MNSVSYQTEGQELGALLSSPSICASYLNDCLETGDLEEIANALATLRSARGAGVRSIQGGPHMQLVEILEILDRSGLRLVATLDEPA